MNTSVMPEAGQQRTRPGGSLRILHVTDNLRLGGLQSVLVNLANGQAERGHRVAIAADDGEMWNDVSAGVARLGMRNFRRPPLLALELRKALRGAEWDVVHTHQRGVSTAVRVAKRGLPVAHVEHVHSLFLPVSMPRLSFRAEALIACGSAVGRMLVDDYGKPAAAVHEVLNGVPDHRARSRLLRGRASGPVRMVNIARVTDVKDPGRFIRVIAALRAEGIDAVGQWIGGGELLEEMREEVRRQGLHGVVDFSGPDRDARARLEDVDVFLSTSRVEGLPLALIEACAAGLPVVAPAVGGIPEVVEEGANGVLFDAEASDVAVVRSLRALLESRDRLLALGMQSRRIFEARFSLGRVLDDVDRVYARVREASGELPSTVLDGGRILSPSWASGV